MGPAGWDPVERWFLSDPAIGRKPESCRNRAETRNKKPNQIRVLAVEAFSV